MPSDGVGEQFNVLVATSLLLHIPGHSQEASRSAGKGLCLPLSTWQQRVILQQTLALLLLHCFDCLQELEPGSILPQSTTLRQDSGIGPEFSVVSCASDRLVTGGFLCPLIESVQWFVSIAHDTAIC